MRRTIFRPLQFYRQLFWSSGIKLGEDAFEKVIDEIALDIVDLPSGDKAMLSLTPYYC